MGCVRIKSQFDSGFVKKAYSMKINEEKIKEETLEEGFAETYLIDAGKIPFQDGLRQFCEENRCGQFNRNHSCPPVCGTEEEMWAKVRAFDKALIFVSRYSVKNAMDGAETSPLKKDHSKRARILIKRLVKEGLVPDKGLKILAGPCSFCAKCTLPEGKECTFPEERASCLSAYSVNVMKLAEEAGFELSWDLSQTTFIAMYVFNDTKE